MPLFKENPKETQTNTQTLDNSNKPIPKPEETGLIKTLGQLLPLAPLVFEQFTGQKIPAMSGTMAEIQLTLTHLQTGFQTVVNNQQQLAQRLINLETKLSEIQTSANQHLSNLTQQFNSLRLTHTREKKEIAYNNPHSLEE